MRETKLIKEKYDISSKTREKTINYFIEWFINSGIVISSKQKKGLNNHINTYIDDNNLTKKFSFARGWRAKRKLNKKLKKKPDSTFLIRMKYNNGTLKNFMLSTTDMMFKHGSKWYFLYYEESWFNINHQVYELEYQENFALPINREVCIKFDKEGKTSNEDEVFANVTPSNIKDTVEMEYVRALVSGEELSKYLKIAMVLSAFTVIGMLLLAYQIYTLTKPTG